MLYIPPCTVFEEEVDVVVCFLYGLEGDNVGMAIGLKDADFEF